MTHLNFAELLNRINRKTAAGEVIWKESADEDTFVLVLQNGSVEIRCRLNFDSDTGEEYRSYEATLLNRSGRVVESMTSKDEGFQAFSELFQSARSQARSGESLVNQLLQELN